MTLIARLEAAAEGSRELDAVVVPDCQSCGACCRFSGDVVVGVRENVPRYLTRSVRNVVGYASYEADYLRRMALRPDGACAALRGQIGESCRCAIYDRRPSVCREFSPGSEDCLAALRAREAAP